MESPYLRGETPRRACGTAADAGIIRGLQGNRTQRMRLRRVRAAAALAALAASLPLLAEDIQSRDDAWWTGPMLAASAASLPQGHALIEPYLFNVISTGAVDAAGAHRGAPRDKEIGSLTYMLYGLTDRFTVGMIPRFFYQEPAGAPNSSGVGLGDLQLQVGYGLTQYHEGSYVPALSLVIDETLPTGRYDHLSRASDGLGGGAYATGISLYSQDYFWMPTGRILRARLDFTYTRSGSAPVADASVYGTASGFRGRAYPGDGYTADAAAEYSVTRSWVLALDVVYQYDFNTRVAGTSAAGVVNGNSGSSYSVGFAPAIEYNWSARAGVLLGVRIISLGRNITTTVTPAVAVNLVF
jgi:hypothetical protein